MFSRSPGGYGHPKYNLMGNMLRYIRTPGASYRHRPSQRVMLVPGVRELGVACGDTVGLYSLPVHPCAPGVRELGVACGDTVGLYSLPAHPCASLCTTLCRRGKWKWRWMVSVMPWPPLPGERAPEPVWMLCLINQALRHKGVLGSGCVDPRFLVLGTSWMWVVSFTPRPLYPRYSCWRWTHRASGDDVEEWKFLSLPGLEHQPLSHPARSTICMLQRRYNLAPLPGIQTRTSGPRIPGLLMCCWVKHQGVTPRGMWVRMKECDSIGLGPVTGSRERSTYFLYGRNILFHRLLLLGIPLLLHCVL
jgi:hypothetical protein